MNHYAVTSNDGRGTIVMEADYYEFKDGFLHLFGDNEFGGTSMFASYNAGNIQHVVLQKEYPEAELVAQIEYGTQKHLLERILGILKRSPRVGPDVDNPEGSRYIMISDTLGNEMAEQLSEVLDSLRP